jgi:hypothetical protein
MCDSDVVMSAPAQLGLAMSASQRAELRRQKILAKGAERMSKVCGLTKSSSNGPVHPIEERQTELSDVTSAPAEHGELSTNSPAVPLAAFPANGDAPRSGSDKAAINHVRIAASGPFCELPSLSKLPVNDEGVSRIVSAPLPQRAPGLRSFHAMPADTAIQSRALRPLSRNFWWSAAVWAVAATFCCAVYAHTMHLLPPAPYVLILVVVTPNGFDAVLKCVAYL